MIRRPPRSPLFPTRRSSDLQLVERGSFGGRCPGQSIRSDAIEPMVWADIEAWLRNPVEVLADLEAERATESHGAVVEAEVDRKSTRLNSSHLVISYAVFFF